MRRHRAWLRLRKGLKTSDDIFLSSLLVMQEWIQ